MKKNWRIKMKGELKEQVVRTQMLTITFSVGEAELLQRLINKIPRNYRLEIPSDEREILEEFLSSLDIQR